MAIDITPSKNSSHDLVTRPYLWLTIAAFWELVLSIGVIGFSTISIYNGIITHEGAIGPTYVTPKTISYVPSLISGLVMAAGGFLIIFKRKTGIYVSIVGLASFPAYYLSYWNVLAYGDSPSLGFYTVLLPFMIMIFAPPLGMLVAGWKRTKWN